MLWQYFRQFLGSISKHVSSIRTAARVISQNQGLSLLLNARLAPRTHSQPDVYPFAAYLGHRFGCTHVIAIGRPTAKDLMQLHPQFKIIGIVPIADLELYRNQYGFGTWLEGNLDRTGRISLAEDILKRAIIVCTNMIEQPVSPAYLLENLKNWLDHAPVCILTSTDRDLNRGSNNHVCSAHAAHPGRWNLAELEQLLHAEGFNLEFIGLTASDNFSYEKKTILAVITNNTTGKPPRVNTPSDFRVVAFMAAYNEEDIIVQSIKKWTDQGINVYILENWSTDATYDLAKQLESRFPVTVERFPKEGPSKYFDWGAMLERIEALSKEIKADWFIRRGVDEVLMSPWPDISYRDSLYLVDRAGFNCVDHTVIEFHPVDDGFEAGTDHETYFRHFNFGKHPSNFLQRKTWKNYKKPISMVPSGGHDLPFEGRWVYPFKFLLKHYPVRSQKHGEKKVFRERKARWNPEERARGWHVHYDSVQGGHLFLRPPSEQELFDEGHFNKNYLVERLSGIGVLR